MRPLGVSEAIRVACVPEASTNGSCFILFPSLFSSSAAGVRRHGGAHPEPAWCSQSFRTPLWRTTTGIRLPQRSVGCNRRARASPSSFRWRLRFERHPGRNQGDGDRDAAFLKKRGLAVTDSTRASSRSRLAIRALLSEPVASPCRLQARPVDGSAGSAKNQGRPSVRWTEGRRPSDAERAQCWRPHAATSRLTWRLSCMSIAGVGSRSALQCRIRQPGEGLLNSLQPGAHRSRVSVTSCRRNRQYPRTP